MSNGSTGSSVADKPARKRKLISIPFLIIAPILGVIAYYSGPTVLTYCFLIEEKWKAQSYFQEAMKARDAAAMAEISQGGRPEAPADPAAPEGSGRGERKRQRPPADFDEASPSKVDSKAAESPIAVIASEANVERATKDAPRSADEPQPKSESAAKGESPATDNATAPK